MRDDERDALPRWDLSRLYGGPDDPAIEKDLEALERMATAFEAAFRGRVAELLGPALYAYERIKMRESRLVGYFDLLITERAEDRLAVRQHEVVSRWEAICADRLEFFEQEISEIEEASLADIASEDGIVRNYLDWVRELKAEAEHYLDDEAEEALAKRESYGAGSWYRFYRRTISQLRIPLEDGAKTANELDHAWRRGEDRVLRRRALETLNAALKERVAPLSMEALNMIVGEKRIDDRDRRYEGPMAERNDENRVDQALVDAMTEALHEVAYPAARRYARMKASLLGLPHLEWSDLWAPYPFAAHEPIPFGRALEWAFEAYRQIDPRLAEHAERLVRERYVDVQPRHAKYTGAFCQTLTLPNRVAASYAVMSYYGALDDASTLCHELMHGVNDQFLVPEHGPILSYISALNAELAGVMGDELWYQVVRREAEASGDRNRTLGILLYRIELVLFYLVEYGWNCAFERRIHAAKRPLLQEEYAQAWMESLKEVFGHDGRNVQYGPIDGYWAFIELAGDPFYTVAYPMALPVAHAILARRRELGDRFPEMLIDLLKHNSRRSVAELAKPFGINVLEPNWYKRAMRLCLEPLLIEAEKLARELSLIQ